MAGCFLKANTVQIATGTSAKTILQIVAASNHAVLIHEWSISFEGVTNTGTPVEVVLMRQTTAGTMSSLTLVKDPDDWDETIQTTAQHTSTSEPTSGDVLFRELVHPQTGLIWQAPWGRQIKIGGGDRVGLVVTSAANIDCVCRMILEE